MMIDISKAPFPITYRQLWLPKGIINNTIMPSSVYNNPFTGGRKATTSDGVNGNGVATSNIITPAGAEVNAQAKFWIFIRFRFNAAFAAAGGNQYIATKRLNANDYIDIYFSNADGKLHFVQGDGAGGIQFELTSTTIAWNGGQWYGALCSLSNTAGGTQRMLIDSVAEDPDVQAALATPNGGDLCVLSSFDGGANGFKGTIESVVVGTDDLTANEEADLFRGMHPTDAVYDYPYDEGRGVTADDRGTAGNDGVLDSGVKWKWGTVKEVCLSLRKAVASSLSGQPISGDITVIWVGKLKATYHQNFGNHVLWQLFVNDNNYMDLIFVNIDYYLRLHYRVNGVSNPAPYLNAPAQNIGDYAIFICPISATNLSMTLSQNGSVIGSRDVAAPQPDIVSGVSSHNLGRAWEGGWVYYDYTSSPMLFGVAEGCFSEKQILTYSRWLKNVFNLPLTI